MAPTFRRFPFDLRCCGIARRYCAGHSFWHRWRRRVCRHRVLLRGPRFFERRLRNAINPYLRFSLACAQHSDGETQTEKNEPLFHSIGRHQNIADARCFHIDNIFAASARTQDMKAVVDQIVAETYEGLTVAPGISCQDLASATHKWVMSRCQSGPSVAKMSPFGK